MTSNAEENSCKFICSRGILKSCDIHSITPISTTFDIFNYTSTFTKPFSIYVCGTDIRKFMHEVLPNITQHFVLVSGDCDISVPFDIFNTEQQFEEFIQNPLILRWYSQNCTLSNHPKMVQMPIGLDYHTLSSNKHIKHQWGTYMSPIQQEALLISIKEYSLPTNLRIPKAYCNFQFTIHYSKFKSDRYDAIHHFPAELTYYEPLATGREHAWREQTKYAFVLSPHGNGLDCHRTWEALCLGCIPIVKTSALDPMYEGFPVLILSDWNQATEEFLAQKMEELTPLFESPVFKEKTQLRYWMERIQSDAHSLSKSNIMPTGVWDNADKHNYDAHVQLGAGQICNDEFALDIEFLASSSDYHTYLEVGTWNGLGSTMAFRRGFEKRGSNDYTFYSLECNAEKCRDAQTLHSKTPLPNFHILNEVVWNKEPANFYEVFPQCNTDAMYKHWNDVDLANMKKCPVFLDRSDLPAAFDVVLLDGGEFTTYFEFQLLKDRCRMLLLDDTNVDKCKLIVQELKSDPRWKIVKEVNVRNGYLIAKRV